MRKPLELTFDPSVPLAEARTIPSHWYTNGSVYEAERRTVFRAWQVAARADQLTLRQSYVTAELAGEPVAVVRDEAGDLRAFYNVCRHRAAPLLNEPCGTATRLRCRYHGWTYDLQGRLRGTPEFDGVRDFDKDANGLVPLEVAAWGPVVWVSDPPSEPLMEYLDPLPAKTSGLGLESLCWAGRKEYDLNCNWKVYVDNYLDGGYHVNTVHPGLAGVLDYSMYRTDLYNNCSVQVSPLKPADGKVEGAVRTGDYAYYWWVFPNFMMNIYSGVMDTNLVLPLGPEKCRVVFDFYFADGTDPAFIADSIAVADRVQDEDMTICEEVQRGLHSRSYNTGRFSVKRENGGHHFHQLLAGRLRDAL